jgi:lipopolysaccharide transport system ATP-binding protein
MQANQDAAIRVDGISKRYRIGVAEDRTASLPEALMRAASAPLRRFRNRSAWTSAEELWALRDVSFEVPRGRVLGIIGRNGAGKSTLLKILSRITDPTSGSIEVNGRVASLLEVGTGFHPELTGRENIFLNGAILGMSRREIVRKFDEIVAFAEVERFIETPVKRYSSGMQMRLAFGVAAHLEPEILVIDEVLAVGDASFQKKCLGKMENVAAQGRTVLFVSHNMSVLRQLCTHGVLLRQGQVARIGSIDGVVGDYLDEVQTTDEIVLPEPIKDTDAYFSRMCLLNPRGEKTSRLAHTEPFVTELEYVVRRPISGHRLWWMLARNDGVEVVGSGDLDSPVPLADVRQPGRYVARVHFPGGLLNEGRYQYRVALGTVAGDFCDYQYGSHFEIHDDTEYGTVQSGGKRHGVLLQQLLWEEERKG